jgi:hypothetical protein
MLPYLNTCYLETVHSAVHDDYEMAPYTFCSAGDEHDGKDMER